MSAPAEASDPVSISVSDATVTERDGELAPAVFSVSLSGPSPTPVGVSYDTVAADSVMICTAQWPTPCARAVEDYNHATGTVAFAPGETRKTFTVWVVGDNEPEITETFSVMMNAPTNGWLANQYATGHIRDDDPALSIDYERTVVEPDSGTVNAVLLVSLSTPAKTTVSVKYATAPDQLYIPEIRAQTPEDYRATSGTLSFAPGTTSKSVAVPVNGDNKKERNETFVVRLSSPTNAAIWNDEGRVWIVNDD